MLTFVCNSHSKNLSCSHCFNYPFIVTSTRLVLQSHRSLLSSLLRVHPEHRLKQSVHDISLAVILFPYLVRLLPPPHLHVSRIRTFLGNKATRMPRIVGDEAQICGE
jgi:hypothetical protein